MLISICFGGGGVGWVTFTAEGKGGNGEGPQGTSGPWAYIFCDEENVVSVYDNYANFDWIKGGGTSVDGTSVAISWGEFNVNDVGWSHSVVRSWAVSGDLLSDVQGDHSMFKDGDPVASWAYIDGVSKRAMTTQEAYLFSAYTGSEKETYQKAYWLLPAGGTSNGGTISGSPEQILADEAATYERYKNAGVKPLNIYSHDATTSYSYDNEEFLVGPFSVSYTRFFCKINGSRIRQENVSDTVYNNGKVDFAGLVYMQLTIDNGTTITLDENHFVYTQNYSSLHSKDTGYAYPYEEDGQFYIRLSRAEVGDAYRITGLSARYKTLQGEQGEAIEIDSFYATGRIKVNVTAKEMCEEEICWYICECGNESGHGPHKAWIPTKKHGSGKNAWWERQSS